MKETILLTFILPCYNVEKYVQQCLDSIYECDLPEDQFEVLCINDCSPDNTQEILELNQKRHSNLRIIVHESNKGLGGARNTGIREAKGRYLWFIDSDDTVIAFRLGELLKRASNQDLDLFCFNYRSVDEEGLEISKDLFYKDTIATNGLSFADNVYGHCCIVWYMYYVVRFIFKTDYIRGMELFFPEKVAFEDTVFMARAVLNAKRIASVSYVMYSYRHNPNGITATTRCTPSAKLIYDSSLGYGGRLLKFSDEIEDEELKESFKRFAISYTWLNSFGVKLLRTSHTERKKFFQLLRGNREEIAYVKGYLGSFNKLLLIPIVGPLVADIGSVVYKLKHSQK